jgi:hypothetical protein
MVTAVTENGTGNALWIPGYDEGAPTIDKILSLFRDYRPYYQGFHGNCAEEEDYYFLRKSVPVPQGVGSIDPVKPATAPAIINVATDHVDVNNFSIDVPLASPRSQARAERLKKFYQGAWLQVPSAVRRTAVRHAFLYGIGFFKDMWAAEQWPDAPHRDSFGSDATYKKSLGDFLERRRISFPFKTTTVNPKNLIWDDSRARMKWVIEFYQFPARDIKRRYPEWTGDGSSSMLMNWLEYWDEEWCGYIADNQFVWGPYRHGYGFQPYSPICPANTADPEAGSPHERYRGLLRPIHSLLDSEARLVTQYETILRTYAWRTLDFKGPRQQAEATSDRYELFGSKNIVDQQVEVAASPNATPPPEILQQLNMVQTMIEEATFPNVIRGLRPRGVSTGFAVSVLAGMGRLVFQGVADGLKEAMQESNKHRAMLVENKVMGKVTVHARGDVHNFDQAIGPEDIRGYYENIVMVKAEAPEEREREAILAMKLYQGIPGFSAYEALKRAGVANPLDMMNQRAAEDLLAAFQPDQLMRLRAQLGEAFGGQLQEAAELGGGVGGGGGIGSQNAGEAQLGRPGERFIQQQRLASRGQSPGEPAVYPQGFGGLENIGQRLGTQGGAVGLPSGQTVR